MTDFAKLKASILKGKKNDTVAIVQAAIDAGESASELIDKGMIPAMREIGDKFSAGDAYVPELLVAARTDFGGERPPAEGRHLHRHGERRSA